MINKSLLEITNALLEVYYQQEQTIKEVTKEKEDWECRAIHYNKIIKNLQSEIEELQIELQCAEEDKLAVIEELEQLREETKEYKESHETLQQLIEAVESGAVVLKTQEKRSCLQGSWMEPEIFPYFVNASEEERARLYKEYTETGKITIKNLSFEDEYGCEVNEIPTFLGETEEQRIENYKELRDRGFDIREHSESGDGWKSQSITMTYNG